MLAPCQAQAAAATGWYGNMRMEGEDRKVGEADGKRILKTPWRWRGIDVRINMEARLALPQITLQSTATTW